MRSYAAVLKSEIALLQARLPAGVRLSRLHWGGGTPTLLPPELIRELVSALHDAVPPTPESEFSVEIDPNEIDGPRLDALVEGGMNRISIGVQDFDPDIQKVIGRDQSYEATRRLVEDARDRGVPALTADILFGLPNQTRPGIARTMQQLLALAPDRVALGGYAHVPWMSRRQLMISSDTLPRPEDRLSLFETARELLRWDGFAEVGIDHFARPDDPLARARAAGRLRRSFQGYTDDRADVLIGLGASAISRFPWGYAQNAPSTSDYMKTIRGGHFSTSRGHVLTDEDRLRGRMIEQLMCDFRISRAQILARFGISPERLQAMFEAVAIAFPGAVEVTGQGLEIDPAARALTRMIARRLDAYDENPLRPAPPI